MSSPTALRLFDRHWPRLFVPLMLGLVTLVLTSLGEARANGPRDARHLRVAVTLPNDIDLLDPNKSFYSTYDIILNPLFDKLMSFDQQGARQMLAAKTIDFAHDGMSIRITLGEPTYWSYGEAVVAADFVRGFTRAAMGDSRSLHLMSGIRGAEQWAVSDYSRPLGIEAPDDRTILIHLNRPFGYDTINLMNMQAHPYPAEGRNPTQQIASNGPYVISAVAKEMISLVRNPYYRGVQPQFDTIEFIGFSTDVAVDYFISGKADVLLGPLGKQKKWLLNRFKNNTIETGLPRKYYIVLAAPTTKGPVVLGDPAIRHALYAALDREAFERSGLFFKSQWQCGFIPAAIPCSEERLNLWHGKEGMDAKVRKAKEVMQKAGYSRENPLRLTLVLTASIHGYTEIAGFVKSSWQEIGVEVEFVHVPSYAAAFQAMKSGKYNLLVNSFYQMAAHQYIYHPVLFGEWALEYGPRSSYIDDLVLRTGRSAGAEYEKNVLEAERFMIDSMTTIPISSDSQIGFYADHLKPNQANMPKIKLRYFSIL